MRQVITLPSIVPQGPQSQVYLTPLSSLWHMLWFLVVATSAAAVIYLFFWVLTRDYTDEKVWNTVVVKTIANAMGMRPVRVVRGRKLGRA